MKKLITYISRAAMTLLTLVMAFATQTARANYGWYDTSITIGGITANFSEWSRGNGAADTDLGFLSDLTISSVDFKIWDDSNDRGGANMYFRLYGDNGQIGDDVDVWLGSATRITGDHDFSISYTGSFDLADAFEVTLEPGKTYYLNMWAKSYGNAGDHWYNGDGDNYHTKFIYAKTSGSCGENVTYTYSNETKTLTIRGTGAMEDYSKYTDCPWDIFRTHITSLVIEDGVTHIGNRAFVNCSKLESASLPTTLTSIGDFAFSGTGLTSITIPASVASIGTTPLSECSRLATITVDETNSKYNSRNSCNAIIKTATNTLIQGCSGSIIPDGVTSIGDEAFSFCDNLTTITIPASVTSIGELAFNGCYDLEAVTVYATPSCYLADSPFGDTSDQFYNYKIYVFNNLVDDFKTNWSAYSGKIQAIPDVTANQGTADNEYWSTYYNELANVQMPSGTQVFKVTLTGTTLEMTEITDGIVNKGEGVVLKSNSASITLASAAKGSDTSYEGNSLKGTMSSITNPGNAFVLYKTDTNGVGFYKLASDGTIGANKAYLTYDGTFAREFFLFDEATGISATLNEAEMTNNHCYDLQGRRVTQPTKGLYIVNGKKIIK